MLAGWGDSWGEWEQPFLRVTHCGNLIDIAINVHPDVPYG